MSISSVNSQKVKMSLGTRVLIQTSSGVYLKIENIQVPSFFEYMPGLKEILWESNAGRVPTNPQNGDERPTELKLNFWGTASVGATEVEGLLSDVETSGGANGFRRLHDFNIEVPTFDGATTGKLYRFRYCAIKPGGLSVKAGSSFDEYSLDLLDFESKPTISSFSSLIT